MFAGTFEERVAMCKKVHEGCELEDAIGALLSAANTLRGIADYFEAEMVLLIAEQLCYNYMNDWLRACQVDWDDYNACSEDVFAHFCGGAKKLTEKEYNERQQ